MPEELRGLEAAAREHVSKKLSRGKVEATLRLRSNNRAVAGMVLDQDALASLGAAIEQVRKAIPQSAPVDPLKVIQWPGVMASNDDQRDALSRQAMECLNVALDDLVATREREGEKTALMLSERCEKIASHLKVLRQHRPSVVERQREKLITKLSELDIDHNEHRMEQELVFVAQRLDIDEELDRLAAHVSEFDKAIKRKGPVGRRLDFLMQEFNREANTIGSKASDLDATGASVDIKVLIEQMREQVQNIE
ncbi:UNVERIFIED_CONTAM: hypothetical protein GTU68_036004 [Idotea baltica]|nr:hypothetical protein [Idotea baltica]